MSKPRNTHCPCCGKVLSAHPALFCTPYNVNLRRIKEPFSGPAEPDWFEDDPADWQDSWKGDRWG